VLGAMQKSGGRTPGEHLCKGWKSKHGAATVVTRRCSGREAVQGALLYPPDGLGLVSSAHAHKSCSLQYTHKRNTAIPDTRASASQHSRKQACKRYTAHTYAYKCGACLCARHRMLKNLTDLCVSRWPPKASKRRPVEERRCLQHL
jgi:hypothetical protein